jgi:hypothetical protein
VDRVTDPEQWGVAVALAEPVPAPAPSPVSLRPRVVRSVSRSRSSASRAQRGPGPALRLTKGGKASCANEVDEEAAPDAVRGTGGADLEVGSERGG